MSLNIMHISTACPGGTPRDNRGETRGNLVFYLCILPVNPGEITNFAIIGRRGRGSRGLSRDNLNFINEVHNWCELKIAGLQRKISIANLLFMIFCSDLAKI
jgi:hypothetical protein